MFSFSHWLLLPVCTVGTVEGIHVAVSTMKKGERSQFIFKPDYYYGHMGCPPRIPPDCTGCYHVAILCMLVSIVCEHRVDIEAFVYMHASFFEHSFSAEFHQPVNLNYVVKNRT